MPAYQVQALCGHRVEACCREKPQVMKISGTFALLLIAVSVSQPGLPSAGETLPAASSPLPLQSGLWRAWLDCEGNELPFVLLLKQGPDGWVALIRNGREELVVDRVTCVGESIEFEFTQYEAMIQAKILPEGRHLDGVWRRRLDESEWTTLPFHAEWGDDTAFHPGEDDVGSADVHDARLNFPRIPSSLPAERWQVEFDDQDGLVVGLFTARPEGRVEGTFITTTGDYRVMSGELIHGRMRLSRFDGSHAYLFLATLQQDGRLEGRFWESGYRRGRWRAAPDEEAVPPATFDAFHWAGSIDLRKLLFSDLNGKIHSLAEDEFKGKALVLDILFVILITAVMALYDPTLTLLMVMALIGWSVWRALILPYTLRLSTDIAQAESSVQTHFLETLRSMQTVKVMNGESQRESEWRNLFADATNSRIQVSNLHVVDAAIRQLLFQGARVASVYLLARRGLDGQISIG